MSCWNGRGGFLCHFPSVAPTNNSPLPLCRYDACTGSWWVCELYLELCVVWISSIERECYAAWCESHWVEMDGRWWREWDCNKGEQRERVRDPQLAATTLSTSNNNHNLFKSGESFQTKWVLLVSTPSTTTFSYFRPKRRVHESSILPSLQWIPFHHDRG